MTSRALSSFLAALVAFAATPGNEVSHIVSAVIVGNLHTWPDVLEGAYDNLVAYDVGLGIGPARMICVSSEILSARSVNRPTAVDLVKITVASGLKFIGLLGRQLTALVFDDKGALLDRRCSEKAKTGEGSADTESSLAGHSYASTTIRGGQPAGERAAHLWAQTALDRSGHDMMPSRPMAQALILVSRS